MTSVDIQDVSRSVTGPVFGPGNPDAAGDLAGANAAAHHEDAVVIGATNPDDVRDAVQFAAAVGRPVVVLATGHGGASSEHSVVVNTRRMNGCRVDPSARTARVEAGVRWHQVIDAAAAHGLAPLNGSSPDVGVAGYTLGGGLSMMRRKYGYAADHVRAIEVVTADGRLLRTDPTTEPDLFWALRGGGKGSLGVVTALEIDLLPVSRLYGGALVFPGTDAAAALHAYRVWAPTLPDTASTSAILMRLPDAPDFPEPLRGTCTVHLRFTFVGGAADGEALLAPIRALGPPIMDWVRELPYQEVGTIANEPTDPMPVWEDATLLRELGPDTVDTLLAVAGPQVDLPVILMELRQLGGALDREPAVPNAVGSRGAAYALGFVAPFPPPLRGIVPGAVRGVIDAVQPWSTGLLPLNYLAEVRSPDQIGRAWPEPIYRRLLEVKDAYDPQNLFRGGFALRP